jgi:hypothetical protein
MIFILGKLKKDFTCEIVNIQRVECSVMKIRQWYASRSNRWMYVFYVSFIPGLLMSFVSDNYGRDHAWVFLVLFSSIAVMFAGLIVAIFKIARIQCPICGDALGIPARKWTWKKFDGPCPHCSASFEEEMPD